MHRILAVDDNETNLAVLEEALGETYQLETVTSGEAALDAVGRFQPDLVLLDIMMPGMNGYEVCRRLRADPTLRHLKILIVSAKALVSERLEGYAAGADDYITKPFDEEELKAKLRVYLRLKSMEEVNQLKNELLALIGHETRTPLNGVLVPLELLRSGEGMSAREREELLDIMEESTRRLHRLIERVLKLGRLKRGDWDFRFAEVDLAALVSEAAAGVETLAREADVRLELDLPRAAPAHADPAEIRSVVQALLENAIRHGPRGAPVRVSLHADGPRALLSVHDRGRPIDPGFLARIFEEFAVKTPEHHGGGIGLSLAIARQVVLAHNGELDVRSEAGQGTTFTLRLPALAPVR